MLRMIRVDGLRWVDPDAIQAIEPGVANENHSRIYLTSGKVVVVTAKVQDVLNALAGHGSPVQVPPV